MKISALSRILIAISALSLISIYFLPVWNIQLWAPQYPEGIEMFIWIDHLSGDVEIINGLNHYIGMKIINQEMFPELQILPFAMVGLILFGLWVAVKGNKRWLNLWTIVLVLVAMGVLVDMFLWGYDYGHNLNPHAAIKVPGMAYQPPLIGYKLLLNFGAYSIPEKGGWVITIVLFLALVLWFVETMRKKRLHV
ncbi:MAG: hypothetical protein KDC92_08365 [Bacteroidetes bacterium]|nr:hypothetical protein [Bacteroidota bacterium]